MTSKLKLKSKSTSKKTEKNVFYHIGNLLIVISLLMAFIIFYPIVVTYLFPPQIKSQNQLYGDYITIPKIKAQAPLILNVDPWNESTYKQALKKGVAHAKGTPVPGGGGRSFIFAHSSGNPLEQTNYNTVFLKLGDLKQGDRILIKKGEKDLTYSVTQTKVVWPSEVESLTETGPDGIVIQTCWPIGTSLKRLLVFAAPVN